MSANRRVFEWRGQIKLKRTTFGVVVSGEEVRMRRSSVGRMEDNCPGGRAYMLEGQEIKEWLA